MRRRESRFFIAAERLRQTFCLLGGERSLYLKEEKFGKIRGRKRRKMTSEAGCTCESNPQRFESILQPLQDIHIHIYVFI